VCASPERSANEPPEEESLPDRSPSAVWKTALGQLELQVTRSNFDTWLRHTAGVRQDGDRFVIGVPSDFVLEWLRSRLAPQIQRTLSQIIGTNVTVAFEVLGAQPVAAATADPAVALAPPPDLNAHLTFQAFTVVDTNRLAYRAATEVAVGEASFNPLLLWGSPGLGKTHLLHAIGHEAVRRGRTVKLLTAQAFVERYGKAVKAGHPDTFRDAFGDCELFLLDDIQFLTTRPGSQELFFHIVNDLHLAGRSLVVTTDIAPRHLSGLSQRLRSRLLAGLTTELRLPPTHERIDLLRAKATHLARPLPDNVLQLIARQPYRSIRDLEGALNQVDALAALQPGPITIELARTALNPLRATHGRLPTHEIVDAVAAHFHLSADQLAGPSRARDLSYARHIAMYLLRAEAQTRLTEIGRVLGGRDHSTVFSGCQRIERELNSTTFPQTRDDVEQLITAIRKQDVA